MDIKDEYKLEIQTPETRKLVGSIKKNQQTTKEWRKCTKSLSSWNSVNAMQFSR